MPEEREVRGGRVRRTAPLVGLAGRTAGEAVVAALRGKGGREDFHRRTAERYAARLGRSRGVLMKAGQLMSFTTLGPLVGEEYQPVYQQALERLQDNADPMPVALAMATVEEELGVRIDDAFAEFSREPLAAASIGQVHAARLPDGREVAVKVQYPGVEKAIRADLANTELLATFLQLMRSTVPGTLSLDVRAMAREISDRIGEEIDYRTEAANQRAFADLYRGHPFIRVPEVLDQLSTRRVLTTELVRGMRWSAARDADQSLRDRWGEVVYRFALGSLYETGLFNADPHPGNYLFHEDGTVTFLDFGSVKRFTAGQVGALRGDVLAAIEGDERALYDQYVSRGELDPASGLTPGELLTWHAHFLTPLIAPQPFTYTREWAAEVVQADYSPTGRNGRVVRKITLDADRLFLTRIEFGMTAVLGALNATGPWRAISEEWMVGGPPATDYGCLHAEVTGRLGRAFR